MAETFNLPSPQTVNQYSSPSCNDPDGILYDSLALARDVFETENPDLDPTHFQRMVQVEWDSMAVKEKVVFNYHSQRIVGFAADVFDLNLIKKEM